MTKQLLIISCSVFAFIGILFAQNKKNKDNKGEEIISVQISVDKDSIFESETSTTDISELEFTKEEAKQIRIDEYLEDMRYNFEEKQYAETIKSALEVLALDSTNTEVYIWCGLAYYNINLYQQALDHFDKAVKLSPNSLTYVNRGALRIVLGYDSMALLDIDRVLELNPASMDAIYNRGLIYAEQEQYEKALDDLNMVIEFNPELSDSYLNRGGVYFMRGEFQQALADYNTSISYTVFAESGNALMNRGLTLIELQQPQEAKQAFEQAIEAYTEVLQENTYDHQSILNRGEVYELLGNYELALPDYQLALTKYQELVEQNPKSPTMIYRRACAYKGLKQYDKALTDLQQVLQLRPLYKQAERDIKEIQKLKEKNILDI